MSQPSSDVLGGSDDLERERHRRRRDPSTRAGLVAAVLLTATFVAIVGAAILTFVGLPYVVMSPGPATNILGRVDGKPLLVLPVVALEEVQEASIFGRAWDSMRLWMQ